MCAPQRTRPCGRSPSDRVRREAFTCGRCPVRRLTRWPANAACSSACFASGWTAPTRKYPPRSTAAPRPATTTSFSDMQVSAWSRTAGLRARMILRLRGRDVVTRGRTPRPYVNADLLEAIGARYYSSADTSASEASKRHGPFDIIREGTGFSPLVFEAMDILGKNGVLVMVSVTGGSRTIEVPADRINQGFVLGNKVAVGSVNAA